MKIEQSFVVPYPREQVWEFFGNVGEVTTCMPGASLQEPAEGDHVKYLLNAKLGPIAAAFAGEADLERDDANYRGVLQGSGRDKRSGSRAKGTVVYTLAEEQGGAATRVEVSVDFQLAGSLAQFSRGGIVNDLAARLTSDFADNLQKKLGASGQAAAQGGQAQAQGGASGEPAPAAELNAGSLLLSVIWGRIRRFFARLLGRG